MIDTATRGAKFTLASPSLELVGFLGQKATDLQMTNLVGAAPIIFPLQRSVLSNNFPLILIILGSLLVSGFRA
jgi:hypothetical protein